MVFELLLHPSYSPDLAAGDCDLSGPMKQMLGRQKFRSDAEVQGAIRPWLGQLLASFFAVDIQKPVNRWDK